MKNFKCTKSTESSKGGFINTLQCKVVKSIDIFGQSHTQESTETYYIKTAKTIAVNSTCDLDISTMFNVTVRDYNTVDKETGEVITIPCKWLSVK